MRAAAILGRLFVVLSAIAAACSDDEAARSVTSDGAAETRSRLRFVNASPDSPLVDAWTEDGELLARGVTYATTTAWVDVSPRRHRVVVRASPSTEEDMPVAVSEPIDVSRGRSTAVLAGMTVTSESEKRLRVLALDGAPPVRGRVRFLHAAPDAPAELAIDLGDDDRRGAEVADLVRFDAADATAMFGPTSARSTVIGVVANDAHVTTFHVPTASLSRERGGDVLVVVTGLFSEPPREPDGFGLLVVPPDGPSSVVKQDPTIHVLDVAPDASRVDVSLDGRRVAEALRFGSLADAVRVAPGTHRLEARASRTEVAASSREIAVEAGERYLVVATGSASRAGEPFQLQTYREGFDTRTGARLRVVQASPDAPPLDVGVLDGDGIAPVFLRGLAFPDATHADGIEAPPARVGLGIAASDDPRDLVGRFVLTVKPSSRSFVVIAGAFEGARREESLRLLNVDTSKTSWLATESLAR